MAEQPTSPGSCWEHWRTHRLINIADRQVRKPREVQLPATPIRCLSGVSYGPAKCQQLDLYLPCHSDFPIVVYVHGGSWVSEDKCDYQVVGRYLAAHGVGAVLINYRLPPETNVTGELKDTARAVAWTWQNIRTYGGDPGRLFLFGHSAGGHLVAVLATDPRWLTSENLSPELVRGVICLEAVFNINSNVRWFGVGYAFADTDGDALSPVQHVRPGLPPFLLGVGEYGPCYMKRQARQFHGALREHGCESEYYQARDQDHYGLALDIASADAPQGYRILEFIRRHSPMGSIELP
jgi:acetyl esterase/lipase